MVRRLPAHNSESPNCGGSSRGHRREWCGSKIRKKSHSQNPLKFPEFPNGGHAGWRILRLTVSLLPRFHWKCSQSLRKEGICNRVTVGDLKTQAHKGEGRHISGKPYLLIEGRVTKLFRSFRFPASFHHNTSSPFHGLPSLLLLVLIP